MKIFTLLFITFTSLCFYSCTSAPEANLEKEREKVMQVLDDFVKAHEERNLDLLLSCFSDKPDIIILGTDEDELWVDKFSMGDAQKRAYETFNSINLSVRDKILKMCSTGQQAWFYMKVNWIVNSEGKEYSFDGIRTTGVLEKEPDGWKLVQIHTSLPVEGQAVRY